MPPPGDLPDPGTMGFSRQEYWSGLPFPSPENLPDPGTEPASPALAGRFFTTGPPGKGVLTTDQNQKPHVTNVKETLACEESYEVESQPGIHQPSDSGQITEHAAVFSCMWKDHSSSCPDSGVRHQANFWCSRSSKLLHRVFRFSPENTMKFPSQIQLPVRVTVPSAQSEV